VLISVEKIVPPIVIKIEAGSKKLNGLPLEVKTPIIATVIKPAINPPMVPISTLTTS
jgi:hypothetical protein